MKSCDRCGSPEVSPENPEATLRVRTFLLQLSSQYCPHDAGEELTDAAMSMELCNMCAQRLVKATNAFLNMEGIKKDLTLRTARQQQ